MAIREIVLLGERVLREEAHDVEAFDEGFRSLVRDMFETMYHADGIGLAATQIGVRARVLVIDLRREDETDARLALVNPKVVWASGETDKQSEGCLSIPGIEEVVERPWAVTVEGFDPEGREVTVEVDDLYSRALQHEIDHLDGVLFLDRVSPLKRRMAMKKWKKLRGGRGKRVRILFWGTPEFAIPALRALDDEGFEVVGVVTQPDRPAGRGRRLRPSPIKAVATDLGFPVLSPGRPRGEEFMSAIRALAPDVSVVVAYGHILRREVLDVPPLGSINVHASLLPELRGAAPINWAIVRGYEETGVTIMRMVEAMDAGPILHRIREPILSGETASELTIRLSELGAEALVEALTLLSAGEVSEEEQNHEMATFAPKVDRSSARIDWTQKASDVARLIRGMDAVPGAWCELSGVPVKLFSPREVEVESPLGPRGNGGPSAASEGPEAGTVVAADGESGLVVATGAGSLTLDEVQPPGKRRMEALDWIRGRGVRVGQRFE